MGSLEFIDTNLCLDMCLKLHSRGGRGGGLSTKKMAKEEHSSFAQAAINDEVPYFFELILPTL